MIWQKIPASGSTMLERFPIQLSIVHFIGRAWVGHVYQLFQAIWTVTVGTLEQFHEHIDVQLLDVVDLYAAPMSPISI